MKTNTSKVKAAKMRLFVHFYCRTAVYCALRNSKGLKISYDWRGMPVEFKIKNKGIIEDGLVILTKT